MITVNKANPTPGEITSSLTGSTGDGAGLNLANQGNISLANSAAAEFGTSDFSLEFVLNQTGDNTSDNYIYYSHSAGNNQVYLFNDISGGVISVRFINNSGSTTTKTLDYDMSADYGTPTHYVFAFDRSADLTLYKNGNSVASVDISSTSSIDIGSGNTNPAWLGSTSSGFGVLGTFYRFRTWNKALTSAEVQTALERADVPVADQYGENNLVDADASVFTSGTYSWSAYGSNTIANVGNALEITYVNHASGAQDILRNASDLTTDLTVGKRYRLTVDAKYAGGSAGSKLQLSLAGSNTDFATLTTSLVTYTHEFITDTAAGGTFRLSGMSAGNVVTIDNWQLDEIGCVSDYDLAFANPTQSLTVQDRSGAADGTCSASGVTQVQKVVQGNLTSLAVSSGTSRTPADGAITADDVLVNTDTHFTTGGTPKVSINTTANALSFGFSDELSYIRKHGSGAVFQWQTSDSGSNAGEIHLQPYGGDLLVGAADLNANVGAKKMQLEGSASTDVGPEMLLHNPAQGGGAASMLTFGGKASGTEGYTAAIKATNTGTLTIGTSSASGGFSEPAADLTIDSTGLTTAKDLLVADGSNDVAVALGNSGYGMALDYSSGDLSFKTNTVNRLTVSNTGLATFSAGIKAEKGIHSGSITIADDAAGSITPPRQGNMMTLTVNAEGSYPGHWGGLLFCDVGLSVTCKVLASQGGSPIGVDTDVTGTTGADVQTTVGGTPAAGAGQIGAIKIENRTGASATYYYTFIG